MTDENTNKMNFFTRIITSIKDFDKYSIFAVEKTIKAIVYLIIIMLIFALVIAGTFTYKFNDSVNKAISYFKDNISDVTYDGEKLSINYGEESRFINENEVIPVIIVNTNSTAEQEAEYIGTISNYDSGILLLNDKIVFKNQMLSQNIEYSYKQIASNYNISDFTKDDVSSFIDKANNVSLYLIFFSIMTLYLFIMYFTTTLVDVIVLAVLGFIFARIVGIKIRFKATFNMGAYALTLPIILNLIYILVNFFTGFEVKYFQWMYTTISYIYMIVAILMIKTDLINRQAELMKIIEEQEKVKREIEEQERRKKEEQEKKKEEEDKSKEENKSENEKNEKKEKKKREKKDKVGDSGLAPQE